MAFARVRGSVMESVLSLDGQGEHCLETRPEPQPTHLLFTLTYKDIFIQLCSLRDEL